MSAPPRDPIHELLAQSRIRRLRAQLLRMLRIGFVVWMLVWGADLATVFLIERAPALPYLLIRPGAALLLLPLGIYASLRPELPLRSIRFIEHVVALVIAVALGLLAGFHDRGLASGHPLGVVLVLMFGLMMPDRWQALLSRVGVALLATPLTMYALRWTSAPIAAQWGDPELRALFFSNYFVAVIGAVLTLVGGDVIHRLRTRVEELKSIGRYRLRRRLAQGGMGEVWVAYHAGLERDVALKIMRGADGAEPVAQERFAREVRTLAELTHPNTVRVFDYGVSEDGSWYYAMELLEGRDLATLSEQEGAIASRRAAKLVLQGARALAEAHARGIVHRDIKPANLFLLETAAGEEIVKLIDFGIARTAQAGSNITRRGMVIGTPGYIAPEVIRGGEATPRADVYGMGMVLRDLMAGVPVFQEITPERVVLAQMARTAAELAATAPRPLRPLLERCLENDPEDRFRDAGELVEALEAALPELSDNVTVGEARSDSHALVETEPMPVVAD